VQQRVAALLPSCLGSQRSGLRGLTSAWSGPLPSSSAHHPWLAELTTTLLRAAPAAPGSTARLCRTAGSSPETPPAAAAPDEPADAPPLLLRLSLRSWMVLLLPGVLLVLPPPAAAAIAATAACAACRSRSYANRPSGWLLPFTVTQSTCRTC
jgi:hypothetical protein